MSWWLISIGLLIVGSFAVGGYLAAPWVPLWRRDVRRMLTVARVQPNELVIDLGAGDGRIIISAARDFGANAIGYELAILPFLIGHGILTARRLRRRVTLRYQNFFNASLAPANVVTAFLSHRAMEQLRPKFEAELAPGTRVVSYAFPIPGWDPTHVDKPSPNAASIYLYVR